MHIVEQHEGPDPGEPLGNAPKMQMWNCEPTSDSVQEKWAHGIAASRRQARQLRHVDRRIVMIDVIIDSNGTLSTLEQAIDECRADKQGSTGDAG